MLCQTAQRVLRAEWPSPNSVQDALLAQAPGQAQDLAESGFLDHVGHLVGPIPEWNLEIPEFNLAQTHESNTGFGLTVSFLKTGWSLLIL